MTGSVLLVILGLAALVFGSPAWASRAWSWA
jgi:hypothetical protein